MINEILLRRKNKLTIANSHFPVETPNTALIATIIKNVEAYGYTFDNSIIAILQTYNESELTDVYGEIIPMLQALTGADKIYKPMYPNFPEQVMEASDAELFVNAIIHYCTAGEWLPNYTAKVRLPLLDNSNEITVLSAGTDEDMLTIMHNLLSSKTSISQTDKDDICAIVCDYPEWYKYTPEEIPLKENVAFIAETMIAHSAVINADFIAKYFRTATDVLRLAVALSDGDISLAENTKFKHFNRPTRRLLLELLSRCGNITEDMYRYKGRWKRLGEILHPGEHKRYNEVNKAFTAIRNKKKPLMFGGKVHKYINEGKIAEAANLLKQRPGEFARALDKLLRDTDRPNFVLNSFNAIAAQVSTPVLLQVREHFANRNNSSAVRIVFPKGNLATAYAIPARDTTEIRDDVCNVVVKICEEALKTIYMNKDFMGNVYIAPEFSKLIVPFSQRSANNANKILTRGSRIAIGENTKVIRGFIWWTNTTKIENSWSDGRVDLDLSACLYDENFNYIEHVSYTNLRYGKAYHSGDITNGGNPDGNGVAEFIDFDIDAMSKLARYVVFQVYSYTEQKFVDMPNVRFGWMQREKVHSGEIFEPKTVDISMDLTSNSKISIPVIFDCKTREFIWCDLGIDSRLGRTYCGGNNLESNLRGVTATCYGITNMHKPSLQTLIKLNADARGFITTDRDNADIIFDNDKTPPKKAVPQIDELTGEETGEWEMVDNTDVPIITAYDIDYFMGELL